MAKCALIQTNSGNDAPTNLAALKGWVIEAAEAGAAIAMSPENSLFMGANRDELHAHAAANAEAIAELGACAKQAGIWLLVGSAAVPSEIEGKLYNRSLLFDSDGEQVALYDKIHLYKAAVSGGESHDETRNYTPGDKAVLCDTPIGKLGLTICYDLRFPQLFRSLAQKGAEVIVVPSAFTRHTGEMHWHTLLKARAIETGCYIVAPAQTGEHPANRKTYGHSVVISPWGEVVAERDTDTGVLLCDIDLEEVAQMRKQIPSLTHDRGFD